jgi:hypothetical protein
LSDSSRLSSRSQKGVEDRKLASLPFRSLVGPKKVKT